MYKSQNWSTEGNQGVIHIASNVQDNRNVRTKHIHIKYHYIKDKIRDSTAVVMKYIETEKQIADVLTKCLLHIKFEQHCRSLNLLNL